MPSLPCLCPTSGQRSLHCGASGHRRVSCRANKPPPGAFPRGKSRHSNTTGFSWLFVYSVFIFIISSLESLLPCVPGKARIAAALRLVRRIGSLLLFCFVSAAARALLQQHEWLETPDARSCGTDCRPWPIPDVFWHALSRQETRFPIKPAPLHIPPQDHQPSILDHERGCFWPSGVIHEG